MGSDNSRVKTLVELVDKLLGNIPWWLKVGVVIGPENVGGNGITICVYKNGKEIFCAESSKKVNLYEIFKKFYNDDNKIKQELCDFLREYVFNRSYIPITILSDEYRLLEKICKDYT